MISEKADLNFIQKASSKQLAGCRVRGCGEEVRNNRWSKKNGIPLPKTFSRKASGKNLQTKFPHPHRLARDKGKRGDGIKQDAKLEHY